MLDHIRKGIWFEIELGFKLKFLEQSLSIGIVNWKTSIIFHVYEKM